MVRMTPEGAVLSEEDKIELAKAKILNELETTYGYDPEKWIFVLKRAEKRIKKSSLKPESSLQKYLTAIEKLLSELEKKRKAK